jgi:hypothetical protein
VCIFELVPCVELSTVFSVTYIINAEFSYWWTQLEQGYVCLNLFIHMCMNVRLRQAELNAAVQPLIDYLLRVTSLDTNGRNFACWSS